MPWSSFIGDKAAKLVDGIAKAAGADEETRNQWKAGTMAAVGGTIAACTGDVIGGGMVAYKATCYALGTKPSGAVGAIATVVDWASGDFSVDADCLTDNAGDFSVDVDVSMHDHSYHLELDNWTSDYPSHIEGYEVGVDYSSGKSLSASYYHDEFSEY